MRPQDDIERSIQELSVTTTAATDKRILDDSFAALEESVLIERVGISTSAWRRMLRSRITKLAAAAVIVVGFLIGLELVRVPQVPVDILPAGVPGQALEAIERAELSRIVEMYTTGDVEGLSAVLSEGEFAARVIAAVCLGEIGDENTLQGLGILYLLAEVHLPEGYTENPFRAPIERIKSRIETERDESRAIVDANRIAESDVDETVEAGPNDTVGVDSNEGFVVDTNVAAGTNVPAETEGSLDLFVVHKQTGEGLAGVKLNVRIQRDGADDIRQQVTDERGRCRIEIGEEKTNFVLIEAKAEHFVPVSVHWGEEEGLLEIPRTYKVALEPGTSIGGFIQNEEGQPIEGATVHLRAGGGESSKINGAQVWARIWDHEETTDANGSWRCDMMPSELDYVEIRLTHPEYVDDESYDTTATPPKRALRDMTSIMVMERGVDLVGRVVNWNGQPIGGAGVRQGVENTWGIYYPSTTTDNDGIFEFRAVRPGLVLLTVQAEGYAPDLREVAVRDGMWPIEFRLGPGQTIRGRVVDTRGEPIKGAQVSADSWRRRRSIRWKAEADSAGRFEWNDAPKDEVIFNISGEGYIPVEAIALSPSTQAHVIEMYRSLQVRGKVVDAWSNAPLRAFNLIPGAKQREESQIEWAYRSAKTFSDGRYETRFDEHNYGYFVRIEADGYLPAVSEMFSQEEEDVVFDFGLEKGVGPSGVVYLPGGKPAEGAEVVLCTSSRPIRFRNGMLVNKEDLTLVGCGADGRFSFPPQTERYLIVVIDEAGYAEITDEELAASAEVTIRAWGRVQGVLLIGGQPAANERVSLECYRPLEPNMPSFSPFYYSAGTDAHGNFVLERVIPGVVKVAHEFYVGGKRVVRSHAELVEVGAGETIAVEIGGKGRAIVGRLALPADINDLLDWANVWNWVALKLPEPPRPEDFEQMIMQERKEWEQTWRATAEGKAYEKMEWEEGRSYAVSMADDGTFRAEDVPAGTYQLQVSVSEAGLWWWGGSTRAAVVNLDGSLSYEFEVPDASEKAGEEPLDVGTFLLEVRKRLQVGDAAPAFEAETFDGQQIRL
ncbi:MAG: carboxypeptidase regulatory-like domain-containing protein, partial [Planctomycetota bacterium]